MEPERWAKICWNEIKRGIKNNKKTDWGRGMRKRLAKLGTDWRGIMAKEEREINDPRYGKSYNHRYGANDTRGLGEGGAPEILSIFQKD